MLPINPQGSNIQRPGQISPLLNTAQVHRPRQAQSHQNIAGIPASSRHHHHNAGITSNPAQGSQGMLQRGGESDLGQADYRRNSYTGTSVGPTQQTTELSNFEEDTSFAFDDLLTPECSSENPLSDHTTPQELIWEQQFCLPVDISQPHILDPLGPSAYEETQGVPGSTALHAILRDSEENLPKFVSGATLLLSSPSALHPSVDTSTDSQLQHQTMNHKSISPSGQKRGDPKA